MLRLAASRGGGPETRSGTVQSLKCCPCQQKRAAKLESAAPGSIEGGGPETRSGTVQSLKCRRYVSACERGGQRRCVCACDRCVCAVCVNVGMCVRVSEEVNVGMCLRVIGCLVRLSESASVCQST